MEPGDSGAESICRLVVNDVALCDGMQEVVGVLKDVPHPPPELLVPEGAARRAGPAPGTRGPWETSAHGPMLPAHQPHPQSPPQGPWLCLRGGALHLPVLAEARTAPGLLTAVCTWPLLVSQPVFSGGFLHPARLHLKPQKNLPPPPSSLGRQAFTLSWAGCLPVPQPIQGSAFLRNLIAS